jgi:NitT/TauT family transport system permease protein
MGPRSISLVLLVLAWQVAAMLAADPLFPPPSRVAEALWQEARTGALPYHLTITLGRVAASFLVAYAIGAALGIAMGLFPRLDNWADGALIVLLNTPALVIVILIYVWLGLVESAAILAVALNKIPIVVVTLREGARRLERDYAEVVAVYRLGPWTALHQVILPQLAPYLMAAARNGFALIWKIVLVVELLGRSNGVGFQLQLSFQMFDVARLLAYAVAFVACALALEFALLQPLERRAVQWRR